MLSSILAFLFTLMISISANAKMSAVGSVLASTEWQKVELEKKLKDQVDEVLRGTLKKDQYFVDVKLDVSEPTQPDFMLTPPPPVKEKVRFSTKTPDAASADYIVFQKLGLEAPIVSEFKQPKKGKKSEFELLWKYNQSLNIFNNLNAIDIKVSVDNRLSEQTIESAKKALNQINFNLSRGIQPSISVETVAMLNEFKEKPKMGLFEKLEWFSKFATMIGLLGATLLAAIFALILFKKYAELKKEELAALANQKNQKEEKDADKKEKTEQPVPAPAAEESQADVIYSGIERFKKFFMKSPTEASIMLKRWLKTGDEYEQQALCALVQFLENDDLMNVFTLLSNEDREAWKKVLATTELQDNLKEISEFISEQVIEEIIVPQKFVDEELSDLLLSISEEQAARFIEEDTEFGTMLLNIMNVKFVSKILSNLSSDLSNTALTKSFENSEDFIKESIETFKNKLKEYVILRVENPFLDRVMQLIPMADVKSEKPLFNSLIEKEYFNELEKIAKKFIPAEIIASLSTELIGELIEYYTMSKKTELVASIEDEELKQKIIDSFAPAGSTAKEMLSIELENYESDLNLVKHIKENKDSIWQEYIDHCRKHLSEDVKFEERKDQLVKDWVSAKKGKEPNSDTQESNQAA